MKYQKKKAPALTGQGAVDHHTKKLHLGPGFYPALHTYTTHTIYDETNFLGRTAILGLFFSVLVFLWNARSVGNFLSQNRICSDSGLAQAPLSPPSKALRLPEEPRGRHAWLCDLKPSHRPTSLLTYTPPNLPTKPQLLRPLFPAC